MTEPYWEPLAAAPASAAASAWMTGDTKISAQAATHADPAGGTWFLADGSAIPGGNAALVALLGPNLPDAKGRTLIMRGTHADVTAIGSNDGVAVANRRPKHRHQMWFGTVNDYPGSGGGKHVIDIPGSANNIYGIGTASDALDAPAYVVVGNLFYHS